MTAGEAPPVPDPTTLTTAQLLREVDRVKELMTSELKSLEGRYAEKLSAVDRQFNLLEQQRVEQKSDTKQAVDAALSAAKEAVGKAEIATTDQLKQLNTTFNTAIAGVTRIIDDLKERVGKVESIKQGGVQERTERYQTGLVQSGWATVGFAVVAILVTILIAALATHGFTK